MPSINPSELIWTVINFFLLYFLLKHFLFTPILRIMDERQAGMDEKYAAEQSALEQVKENEERLAEAGGNTREEAKRLLSDAEAEVRQQHAQNAAEGKAKAKQDRKEAEAALEAQTAVSAAKLKDASPELAALLAEKLLEQD